MKTLVLGYGNVSRTDDGVGWFVAERLQERAIADVEILTAHQLDVDLAETISRFDTVIFVDAAVTETPLPITRTMVRPDFQSHAVAHYLTPGDLLALCSSLCGQEPRGVLFSIRGQNFDFGTALSPAVEQAAREVVSQIAECVKQDVVIPLANSAPAIDKRMTNHQ